MASPNDKQHVSGNSVSQDISEALEARVADGLWFLARQWQFGEFEAEDGGLPASFQVNSRSVPFETLNHSGGQISLNLARPLEAEIEHENLQEQAPAWNSERLGYQCHISGPGMRFRIEDYDGRSLDWNDFELESLDLADKNEEEESFTAIPSQLQFSGAPEPRYWQIEENDSYFDGPQDPEPNILSMLLPEVFYTDLRNWYVFPAPMPSGHLREVRKLQIVDSFGVVTQADPAISAKEEDWSVFAISSDKAEADGSLLLAPHVARAVLDNDVREEVRFLRDENANMVWAWERILEDEAGDPFSTGIEKPAPLPDTNVEGAYYTLKSNTARSWIPYVPRQTAQNPAVDGDISLRRARTDQAATPDDPQYRSQVVSEAKHIHEERIPHVGLRVRRVHRFARATDGEPVFWTGRDRDIAPATKRPNLRFDYIRRVGDEGSD